MSPNSTRITEPPGAPSPKNVNLDTIAGYSQEGSVRIYACWSACLSGVAIQISDGRGTTARTADEKAKSDFPTYKRLPR